MISNDDFDKAVEIDAALTAYGYEIKFNFSTLNFEIYCDKDYFGQAPRLFMIENDKTLKPIIEEYRNGEGCDDDG